VALSPSTQKLCRDLERNQPHAHMEQTASNRSPFQFRTPAFHVQDHPDLYGGTVCTCHSIVGPASQPCTCDARHPSARRRPVHMGEDGITAQALPCRSDAGARSGVGSDTSHFMYFVASVDDTAHHDKSGLIARFGDSDDKRYKGISQHDTSGLSRFR